MQYILINLETSSDALVNRIFNLFIFKSAAYQVKRKSFDGELMYYDNILIPVSNYTQTDLVRYRDLLGRHFGFETIPDKAALCSIGKYFDENIGEISLEKLCRDYYFEINILSELSDSDLEIIYTDGSINTSTGIGGYAATKLIEQVEVNTPESGYDPYTNKYYTYKIFSGNCENGTNNIGELNAVKTAVQNFDDSKKVMVIIADSNYSIQSFREYINTWRLNGYKAANRKPIKNEGLIKEIDRMILDKNKANRIVLFKWTKAHANIFFNELCDENAKREAGVE